LDALPPIDDGVSSPELVGAIELFQSVQMLSADGVVDVDGATWNRLIEIADVQNIPDGPTGMVLSAANLSVVELPQSSSGFPALSYSVRFVSVVYELPGFTVEVSASGPIKVQWGATFPATCELIPDIGSVDTAVKSGDARVIGGAALNNLCGRLKLESSTAVADLFMRVSLTMSPDGELILGGSIGDGTTFHSISFDAADSSISYTGTTRINSPSSVPGGDVQVSGAVQTRVKLTPTDGGADQASIIASLVVLAAAGVLLTPVVEVGEIAELLGTIGAGATEIIFRLALTP
jgi:peptidoglycan hydrolase-like protein with peptidoglycan-binding domain